MTDFNPSRPLQELGVGDPRALGLKVLGAEAMTEFSRVMAFGNHCMSKGFSGAKEAQFPVIGRAAVSIHTPGQEINGDLIQSAERVIALEDLMISPVFIANIDDILRHFEARAPYARIIGQSLGREYDQAICYTAINAARATSTIPGAEGHGDGQRLINGAYTSDGSVLFDGIFDAGVALMEKDVPVDESSVKAFMRPTQYALVVQSDRPLDTDLNPEGNGSLASGLVKRINGIPLVRTNNLNAVDQTANTVFPTDRQQDYSAVAAIVYHRDAIGVLNGVPITMEAETTVRHQGTLVVGKYLAGYGILRPECSVELATA